MAKRNARPLMRMKQLTRAAGVPKGTIQFYIKEGLIPRPIKTFPNMAYYDENHLNAILMIKELQTKRFLPLSVIKQLMRGGKSDLSVHEIRTLVEMDGKLFRNLDKNPNVQPMTATELSKRTGVSLEDIKALERHQILHPASKGKTKVFEEDDILIVECYGKLRSVGYTKELGFDPSLLTIHKQYLERLVAEEGRILANLVTGKVDMKEVIRMVEEGTAIGNTIISVMRKKLIVATVRKYAEEFQAKVMKRNATGSSGSLPS